MPAFRRRIANTMRAKLSPSPKSPRRHALPGTARLLVMLALMSALLPLSACRSNRGDEDRARGAPEIVYERARQQLDQQDFNSAIRTYEALIARYPFVPEARQASLDLIYAYYRGREPESALDQADTFIRENPTHPRIDYAYYLKGLTDFERSANFLERWFSVDLDARPPQTARSAFNSFRKVVEDFPRSAYAHDARRRMIHLRNRLADYEIYVARYYQRREAWVGASQRAKLVIEQYDGAPAVREALEILIECYDVLGMTELAQHSREVYAFNYGGEPTEVVPTKNRWWKLWN
jgi:outer membrane protein assembly factor BamD